MVSSPDQLSELCSFFIEGQDEYRIVEQLVLLKQQQYEDVLKHHGQDNKSISIHDAVVVINSYAEYASALEDFKIRKGNFEKITEEMKQYLEILKPHTLVQPVPASDHVNEFVLHPDGTVKVTSQKRLE